MNFSDLLDEDGQGTNDLDRWLDSHIREIDNPIITQNYTTGDSIDPILDLAKDYFMIVGATIAGNGLDEDYCSVEVVHEELGQKITVRNDTEQLAIAEALFKAYQNEQ